VIAFGKAAACGLPRAMCEAPVEPPRRQAAKEWIANPVPQTRLQPPGNLGVFASWRLAVVAVSRSRPPVRNAIALTGTHILIDSVLTSC
jgi:hypothetical protein